MTSVKKLTNTSCDKAWETPKKGANGLKEEERIEWSNKWKKTARGGGGRSEKERKEEKE